MRLLKRGGEEIHWGFKWKSGALELYQRFSDLSREEKKIAGKFPTAFAQRFTPYGFFRGSGLTMDETFRSQLPGLLRAEFAQVLERQAAGCTREERAELRRRFDQVLDWKPAHSRPIENEAADLIKLFLASSFMHRQTGEAE